MKNRQLQKQVNVKCIDNYTETGTVCFGTTENMYKRVGIQYIRQHATHCDTKTSQFGFCC